MNPSDYYKRLIASITEDDVRRVAEVMAEHIGAENSITLKKLCFEADILRIDKKTLRTVHDGRKARAILNTLVIEYGIPIGAQSGRAGRWICANKCELNTVIADLESRANETKNRVNALRVATIPSELPVYTPSTTQRTPQPYLFEPPKVPEWQLQYGSWR